MSITVILVVWGIITTILIVLLIYRSVLSMREDDQLFLDQTSSAMQQEQTALLQRLGRLQLPVRALTTASVILLLVAFGIWIYRGLNGM